jgi:hypothetical protein
MLFRARVSVLSLAMLEPPAELEKLCAQDSSTDSQVVSTDISMLSTGQ